MTHRHRVQHPLRVLAALATVVAIVFVGDSFAAGKPLAITSSLDGVKVLPQQSRWLAHPNIAPAEVEKVDFLIDGRLRWVEHSAPYVYAGDDDGSRLGYLFTSWLTPGQHRFVTRVKTASGETATDAVSARVVAAPAPPSSLAGTWTRTLTKEDVAKEDPRYDDAFVPMTGTWRIVINRIGIWELDPVGGGIIQAYSLNGGALRAYAPIMMKPRQASGDPGSIHRFGNRIDVGGGIDCDQSGPVGGYRWSVADRQLSLTAVREPCGQRRAIYEGTWARKGAGK
jgi:hypothetical protein